MKKLNNFWFPALIGFLLGTGLLLPVLHALGLTAYGAAAGTCALTALLCLAASLGRLYAAASVVIGLGTAAITLLSDGTIARLGGMMGAALALKDGVIAPLQVYAPEVAVILAIVLTLLGWALAVKPGGFFPAFSLTLIASLACWSGGMRDGYELLAPALVALLMLLSQLTGDLLQKPATLTASVFVVAVALLLQPVVSFTSPLLEKGAEALRTFITDTFFFTETRTVYSLKVDGYMPLSTRLGGPAQPDDHPVMQVETENTLLLRGSIHNQYTGLSWRNTMPSRRYRYSNARFDARLAEATDKALPAEELLQSDLFTKYPVSISMHTDSASTLFSMLRMENLTTPMSLVPYYSTSSEIFITRDLAAGDAYTFDAPVFTGEDGRLDGLLYFAAQGAEKADMSAYMNVPEAVAEDVYTLVGKLVTGCETPLEKARAIQTYLKYNMAYTLLPEAPPDNQDFVSYFLLRGKEGYCTYFASAMAVMGRIAGLPTRYVEGYLVQPSGGLALVTGKDAHAWAEVWFDGFGWVAFDATPPQGGSNSDGSNTPPTGSDSEPDELPDENDPEQQPDTQQPEGGNANAEPSPSPEPETPPEQNDPSSPPDAPQQPESPDSPHKRQSRWWLWLLILLLAAALVLRMLWTLPARAVRRYATPDERLLLWYRALLGLLAAAGLGAAKCESPSAHALRIADRLPEDNGFLEVADSLTMLGYGRYGASPAQVEDAARCYRMLSRSLPAAARIKWFILRTIKGLGSVEQVP